MNELTRYRIELGPRCVFDEHTHIDGELLENLYDLDILDLLFDVSDNDHWTSKRPEIINVVPNQKINIHGIVLKVPSDASKMVKWNADSIKTALVFFLKNDTTLVDDAFAYLICMDNWIEIEVTNDDELHN